MLFKRGSTISAAEGGCQAEVGGKFANELISTRCECFAVACSMAAGGFAACMVSCSQELILRSLFQISHHIGRSVYISCTIHLPTNLYYCSFSGNGASGMSCINMSDNSVLMVT